MILTLSSFFFFPYDSQKNSECFLHASRHFATTLKPPLCPPVLNLTPARPLSIETHLQAPWKTLSWHQFTLSYRVCCESYLAGVREVVESPVEPWAGMLLPELPWGELPLLMQRTEGVLRWDVVTPSSRLSVDVSCLLLRKEKGLDGAPHLQQMSLPWLHYVPRSGAAWLLPSTLVHFFCLDARLDGQ